jgi:hypothetical protein
MNKGWKVVNIIYSSCLTGYFINPIFEVFNKQKKLILTT